MTNTDDQILSALRDRGLDEKLLEAQQLEREETRGDLIMQLLALEDTDEEQGARFATRRNAAERKLREAEAMAAAARRELAEIAHESSLLGSRAEHLRGKIRALADGRIEDALRTLRTYGDRARASFKSRPMTMRTGNMGDRAVSDVGNATEIGDALVTITAAVQQLEALREQPRPDNLPDVLKEIVSPSQNAVRQLVGL